MAPRPTTVDIDTVRDLAALAKLRLDQLDYPTNGPAEISYIKLGIPGSGQEVQVADGALDGLSSHDRNNLTIRIDRSLAVVMMSFTPMSGSQPIFVSIEGDQQRASNLRSELEDVILDNGEPIWRPYLLKYLLPVVGVTAVIGLWVWLLATTQLPIPGLILGWIAAGALAVIAVRSSSQIRTQTQQRAIPHRIRDESRATTFARRANEKRDAKVIVWTALITGALAVPGGFILAVLTNAFGLKG